jgi:FkbM family methyltransferase
LFVDVGAHYGFFTLLAAAGGASLDVIAVEPTPETFAVLERNVALLKAPRVSLHQVAISKTVGTASYVISLSSDNCSFYPHPNAPPLRRLQVETTTIDAILRDRAPCRLVVKIDTDGHEIAVLEGMSDTLDRFEDATLVVEFNPKMQRAAGYRAERLLEEVERLGFEAFLLDDASRRVYRIGPTTDWSKLVNPASYANLYCVRRKRALSVCMFSHSAELGGAERSLLELADELIGDHGALCTVILPRNGPLVDALRRIGASCVVSAYAGWCNVPGRREDEAARQRRISTSIDRILGEVSPAVAQTDPDIVWTQTLTIPWGAVIASLLSKPHVWSICEYGERDHGLEFYWPFERVLADIAAGSNLVYVCIRDIATRLFPRMPADRLRVLYRHIPTPLAAGDARPEFFTRPNAVKLGIFATVIANKGQEDIIRATAQLVARGKDIELLVAGWNIETYRRHLDGLVGELQIADRVHFSGFLADPYPAMRACDVIVTCSRAEAFGRVAVEAMLLSKPVVYPAVGGYAEYMRAGETGLSYPPADIAALTARLEELVDDPDRRRDLGQSARAYALHRFSREGYGGEVFRTLTEMRSRDVPPASMPSTLAAMVAHALAIRASSTGLRA